MNSDSFIQRIKIDSRVALSVVDFDLESGILRHVGIRGKATLEKVNPSRLKRFVGKYLGHNTKDWNQWFVKNIVDPLEVMIEIQSDSTVAKDVPFF